MLIYLDTTTVYTGNKLKLGTYFPFFRPVQGALCLKLKVVNP